MTNQESIECTCRVGTVVTDGRVDGDEVIIHGPCHSPGPEVWEALERLIVEAEKERVAHIHRRICGDCDEDSREYGNSGCRVYRNMTPGGGTDLQDAFDKARKLLATRKEKI